MVRSNHPLTFVAANLAATLHPAVVQAADTPTGGAEALVRIRDMAQKWAPAAIASAQRGASKQPEEHAAVAQSCLALVAAYRRDPSASTKESVSAVASILVDQKDLNSDGRIGWGVPATRAKHKKCPAPGMLDAFGDGSCNPPNTEYTFQTGLAVMCLAQAYEVTGDVRFRKTAEQALDDSWNVGRHSAGCNDCYYYWYSYDKNDADRYVRNTNALMGAAAAWVWKISAVPKYKERASQIVNAELRELSAHNDGYFGIDDRRFKEDPRKESKRIENHVPWVAKGLVDMGVVLKDQRAMKAALAVQDSWQFCSGAFTCGSDCDIWAADAARCNKSVTASPCFHKNASQRYAELCEVAAEQIEKAPNSYRYWAVAGE